MQPLLTQRQAAEMLVLHDGVNFDYDPSAKCPTWEKFLLDLFPDGEEARDMIEEQLGYGMTYDMQFEKIAVWIGLPRAGKSTLLHVQKMLIGTRALLTS